MIRQQHIAHQTKKRQEERCQQKRNESIPIDVDAFIQPAHFVLCVRARFSKIDTTFMKAIVHRFWLKFLTLISPEHFDFTLKHVFNQCFECPNYGVDF